MIAINDPMKELVDNALANGSPCILATVSGDGEQGGNQSAAHGHSRADYGHCASAMTNKPIVGDDHRRMDEAGDERE